MAPRDGFEPPTNELTARRSTTELPGNMFMALSVGLEPTRSFDHLVNSQARLPIPPRENIFFMYYNERKKSSTSCSVL